MKNILNKTKIILVTSVFSLCACSQQNKEEITSNNEFNDLNNYSLLKIEENKLTQDIINNNINEIQQLPKHYLGKISTSLDAGFFSFVDKDELKNKKIIENSSYPNKAASNINKIILAKRDNSNYTNSYAVFLPKDFDTKTLIGEPVYLYQVPDVNIFKRDLSKINNTYGNIRSEDESLNFQNIICFKNMCSIEYDLYEGI